MTGSIDDWNALNFPTFNFIPWKNFIRTEEEEWTHLQYHNGSSILLPATLCFSAFYSAEFNIHASGSSSRTEIPWAGILTSMNDSYTLRRQLGATVPPTTRQERGVLDLKGKDYWIPDLEHPSTATYIYDAARSGWNWTKSHGNRTARVFAQFSQPIWDAEDLWISMHPHHSRLFQYILQDTKRPCIAGLVHNTHANGLLR